MLKNFTRSILLLLCFCIVLPAQAEDFFPYKYENYTLPNGFKSILIPMKGSGLVAYYTVVRTGSRDEYEPGKSGFAHFFEHMMFRGTEKFSSEEYDRSITEMGADNNAYTTDDYTCYTMTVSSDNLEKAMMLESDRFQNLDYSEGAFRTEAGAVYGEYRKNRVNPWSVGYEEISNLAFDKHTYKHTTMGFERDIIDMPNQFEYSKSFFNRYYRPENCVLMVAGDFDVAEVKVMIEKYYKDWEPGYVAPKINEEPPQTAPRFKNVAYEGRTLPLIWQAYRSEAFDPSSKLQAAGMLLWEIAYGENSDLYKKLVIREQKVQFVDGGFSMNRDPKFNSIYSMVKLPDDVDYVMSEIERTAAHFQENLVDQTTLENIKKRNRYSFLMGLDTPDNVTSALARMIALTGDISSVNTFYTTLESVTAEDVREAAKRYLTENSRTTIVIKEAGNAE